MQKNKRVLQGKKNTREFCKQFFQLRRKKNFDQGKKLKLKKSISGHNILNKYFSNSNQNFVKKVVGDIEVKQLKRFIPMKENLFKYNRRVRVKIQPQKKLKIPQKIKKFKEDQIYGIHQKIIFPKNISRQRLPEEPAEQYLSDEDIVYKGKQRSIQDILQLLNVLEKKQSFQLIMQENEQDLRNVRNLLDQQNSKEKQRVISSINKLQEMNREINSSIQYVDSQYQKLCQREEGIKTQQFVSGDQDENLKNQLIKSVNKFEILSQEIDTMEKELIQLQQEHQQNQQIQQLNEKLKRLYELSEEQKYQSYQIRFSKGYQINQNSSN